MKQDIECLQIVGTIILNDVFKYQFNMRCREKSAGASESICCVFSTHDTGYLSDITVWGTGIFAREVADWFSKNILI